MGHPFTVAEFRELVWLALEDCDPGHYWASATAMHPLGASSHLDLPQTCMAFHSPPARPRARRVFAKLKQQASAFVKTPTKRLRSRSCNEDDDGRIMPLRPAPTVTFAPSASRARSASYLSYASTSDASSSSLAIQLEQRPVVPPPSPSPSPSVRSISTTSTRSPITPVFTDHHHHHQDYASTAAAPAVTSFPWSTPNDEPDTLTKGKVQIVRRSLVQDSFMLACAAVDDDGGLASRSPKISRRLTNAPLPPLKPPPSCPLPSPPPPTQNSVPSISSSSTPEEEWTLFLGAPSKPLELAKEHVRERAKSSPSLSRHHHLSPPDHFQKAKEEEEESARVRKVSTRSMATTRRIESGPGGHYFDDSDWTLSLPLSKKPGTAGEKPNTTSLEVPTESTARKCKSFTDWTTSLSAEYEMEERRLVQLEQRERERERKSSHVSLISTKSARAASLASSSSAASIRSSSSTIVKKKQLPIGPGSNHAATTSAISLHSVASTTSPTPSLYTTNRSAPTTPITPSYIDSIWAKLPRYTLIQEQAASSASTSVSTLGKFPLPPPSSFSTQLVQRRQAVPPLPSPLMPSTSVVLRKQFGSPTSYVPSSSPPISAPADSTCFMVERTTPLPVVKTWLGVPSPLRSSYGMMTMNDGVGLKSRNSSRTVSSAETVKMPLVKKEENDGGGECYETCDEGKIMSSSSSVWDVVSETESVASFSSCDVFYSARSSLDV